MEMENSVEEVSPEFIRALERMKQSLHKEILDSAKQNPKLKLSDFIPYFGLRNYRARNSGFGYPVFANFESIGDGTTRMDLVTNIPKELFESVNFFKRQARRRQDFLEQYNFFFGVGSLIGAYLLLNK